MVLLSKKSGKKQSRKSSSGTSIYNQPASFYLQSSSPDKRQFVFQQDLWKLSISALLHFEISPMRLKYIWKF